MSAVVCGKRASSFFEELNHASPPATKRARCCGPASPPQAWSNAAADPGLLAALHARFPAMSLELIEKALEESGNDLDSAIKSLLNLNLDSTENNVDPAYQSPNGMSTEVQVLPGEGVLDSNGVGAPLESAPGVENLPLHGSEWVEILVREMADASDMDDAKARASRVLEVFEKSLISCMSAQAQHSFQKENSVLKEQLEVFIKESTILKRAVAIQHERQKEYDEKNHELQQLKQLVGQYQEQVSNLEVNNYALNMHLRQAQQGSSIPGRFHPDVF